MNNPASGRTLSGDRRPRMNRRRRLRERIDRNSSLPRLGGGRTPHRKDKPKTIWRHLDPRRRVREERTLREKKRSRKKTYPLVGPGGEIRRTYKMTHTLPLVETGPRRDEKGSITADRYARARWTHGQKGRKAYKKNNPRHNDPWIRK